MASLTWQVPLVHPPEVVAIGRNAHGFVPTDRYRLEDLWSLHLYGYRAVQHLNGIRVEIEPGMLGVTPPGTTMETDYFGVSVHIYAHFRLVDGPGQVVPALTALGDRHNATYRDLYEAVGAFSRQPALASARVWSALWTAATLTATRGSSEGHLAVRKATEFIEQNLNNAISVAEVAEFAGVSSGYLARLFQAEIGTSVVGHIRQRRTRRAADLIVRSNLPIKMIAANVGFSDLQQFNKAMRAAYGTSPRELRVRGLATDKQSEAT